MAVSRRTVTVLFADIVDYSRLVSELEMDSWPHRRWAARIYHAFKPLYRADPVLFEGLETDSV
jgi:hypothetical protein